MQKTYKIFYDVVAINRFLLLGTHDNAPRIRRELPGQGSTALEIVRSFHEEANMVKEILDAAFINKGRQEERGRR